MRFIKNGNVFKVSAINLFDNGGVKRLHVQREGQGDDAPVLSILWTDDQLQCRRLPDGANLDLKLRHDCSELSLWIGAALDYHDEQFNVDGNFLAELMRCQSDSMIRSEVVLCNALTDEELLATSLSCSLGCTTSPKESIQAYFDDGVFSHYYCSYCGDTCETDLEIWSDGTVSEDENTSSNSAASNASNIARSTFIKVINIKDPDTGSDVELHIMKDRRSGALVGIDASYLANTDLPVYSPYETGVIYDETDL